MTLSRRSVLLGLGSTVVLAGLGGRTHPAAGQAAVKPGPNDVFIVVDVQNCFTPGGSLAVKEGDQIIPIVNRLAKAFPNVVLTQDWHTADHISFASQHAGKKPFDVVPLHYGNQVLWPDHCVQGTKGAEIHPDVVIPHAQLIIRKGHRQHIDSYSAFYEADGKTPTGLTGYLKDRGITTCYFAGLATDFCVAWSAIDARKAGFGAAVVEDACRGIDAGGSLAKAWSDMAAQGVKRIQSREIAA